MSQMFARMASMPSTSSFAMPGPSTSGFSQSKPKVTVTQLRKLLQAIEDDPTLYNSKESDTITFLNEDKWLDLAIKLNDTLDEGEITIAGWKYIMHSWGNSLKKRRKISRQPNFDDRVTKLRSREEAEEMQELEDRLYIFLKKERNRTFRNVVLTGSMDPPTPDSDAEGMKFVINLCNVSPMESRRGVFVDPMRKRFIVLKEKNVNENGVNVKKFKIVFNEGATTLDTPEDQQMRLNELTRLRALTRELEQNAPTAQDRIEMIKELWKHRCGDN